MINLVDSYVWTYNSDILEQINTRQFPKMVYQNVSLNPNEFDLIKLEEEYPKESYETIRFNVGYVGGKTNPLNSIYFYSLKNNKIINNCGDMNNFSLLINQNHMEHFIRVYKL